MSYSNYCFSACIQVSQEAVKVVWYSHLLKNFPQFFGIHTLKGFSIVNKAEVDVFLGFSCFFYDPKDVGNLISGSSAVAKSLQSCPTLSDPMDCSLPGSSVHGIFQARVLEWVANAFSTGSSTFSKSNLYIWKFLVHILLKPNLKDFEHYLASMWNECNYVVVSTFFGITLLEIGMKTDLFQSCGHCRISKFAGLLSAALL